METDKIALKQVVTSIITVIAVEIAFGIIMPTSRFHPMVILGCTRMIQTAMILVVVVAQGKGLAAIGMEPALIFHGIKRGLVWSAGFGALVALGFVILFIFRQNPLALVHSGLPDDRNTLILFFLVGGVVAPITEETLFRGILYGFLRKWGVIISIFLSAAIFALAHIMVSGAFLIPFIGGILFAASYEKEKNLLTPITIHMLGNLALFTISLR